MSVYFTLGPGALADDDAAPQASAPVSVQQDRRDRIYYPGDTENVVPLTRKLIGNILLDQKAIRTSPFHADRTEELEWLGFTAVTTGPVLTDRRTSKVFENSRGQVNRGNSVSDIGSTYMLIPEVAGFYLYGVIADNEKAR